MPLPIVFFLNNLGEAVSDILIIYYIKGFRISSKKETAIRLLISLIPLTIVSACADAFFTNYFLLRSSYIIISFIRCYILFSDLISESIILEVISYIAAYVIQLPIALFFSLIGENPLGDYIGIVGNTITILLIIIVFNLCKLKRLAFHLNSKSLPLRVILINLGIILLLNDYMVKKHSDEYLINILFIICSIFLIVIANFIIIYEEQRYIIKDRELRRQIENSRMTEDMVTEIRARQHQYNNQIATISTLPEIHKEYESLSAELRKYSKSLLSEHDNSAILQIHPSLIAALVFYKVNQAERDNKIIDVKIRNYYITSKLSPNEIVDILGILIDNMIEATPKGSSATLQIDSNSEKLMFTTKNEGPLLTYELQEKLFSKGFSTKKKKGRFKDKRGYGLYTLKKIIETHNGIYYISNEFLKNPDRTLIVFHVEV